MVYQLPPITGEDPAFLDAIEKCSRLATINRPVLVVGERGTGKELFAARLHYLSPRWNGPLVKVNCAALSESLLESELFGHEAGAFTGAQKMRTGRFELAHTGTLILDEIANASAAVQEKILRVIEYGEFERVGGTQTLHVDVRIVAAANVDLPALAKSGKFRADLLDRLAFDVITIPPLKQRPSDILNLAETFALDISKSLELEAFPGFSKAAVHALISHTWPGNVRELKNVVERALFYAPQDDSPIHDIIIDPFASPWRPSATTENPPPDSSEKPPIAQTTNNDGLPASFRKSVADFEISLLKKALSANNYHQKDTASRLDLSYHQFRRLLHKHKIST